MTQRQIALAILIAALGYFVDVYDIILFNAVRIPSLVSLGYSGDELTQIGLRLINLQLIGMLLGGLSWGILGDKFGRLSILFGSILIYSTATFANAFVTSVEIYGVLRFLSGFGLAGELGAGVTLINEVMPPAKRGYGTMIIVTAGALGSVVGGLVGNFFEWQTAYLMGGIGGFLLLALRLKLVESGLYHSLTDTKVPKGSLKLLFRSRETRAKYLKCLLVGMPFWVFAGMFITLAPELAEALGVVGEVTSGYAIFIWAIGLTLGNIASSLLSQECQSRKKATVSFLLFTMGAMLTLFTIQDITLTVFYALYALIGVGCGSWAIFNMLTAEQFGTNLRATATTSLPNFVRGMIIPLIALLGLLKPYLGIVWGLGLISIGSILLALIAVLSLQETFARNLDFVER